MSKWIAKITILFEIEAPNKQEAFEEVFPAFGHLKYEAEEIVEPHSPHVAINIGEK